MMQGSTVAENLFGNVYRWLSTPESKLYDPLLLELVNQLIRRCFNKLVNEFHRLGATIVLASMNKIIIQTNKKSYELSDNYMDFIIKSIKQNQAF